MPHFLSLPCDLCFLNSWSNFSKVENFSLALAFLGGQNSLLVCGTEREGGRMCLNESLVELRGRDDKPHIVPSYTKLRSAVNNNAAIAGIRPGFYLRAIHRDHWADLPVIRLLWFFCICFLQWQALSSRNSKPNFHPLCLLEQYSVLSTVDKNRRLSLCIMLIGWLRNKLSSKHSKWVAARCVGLS